MKRRVQKGLKLLEIMKLEQQFKRTIKQIGLKTSDKVLVALSGGKDSTTAAYLLKKFGYNIEGLHIDLKIGNYSERCRKAVERLCGDLGIKLHVYDMKKKMGSGMCYLRSTVQSRKGNAGLKNCAVCGVIKKWILNKEARRLKARFIATGHHLDDEAQTFVLNILKGSPELSANSGIKTRNVSDKKFVPRIKPLFYVHEEDIKKYSKKKKLPVIYERCPCAIDSYRIQVREFVNSLSGKRKENIMKNAEKFLAKIKIGRDKVKYCEICGEPSRKRVCKMCELVK